MAIISRSWKSYCGFAFKDKRLKKDDRIIGVAQGDEGKYEDIVGWYVDDAVKKIKGTKGTISFTNISC
jgi:carboxyl-terminal processing protease